MITALFNGVSGLQNHMKRMDTIGNNIANVNTAGFKRNRVAFQDMLYHTIQGATRPEGSAGGTNPFQTGLGVITGSIDTIHTQGSLESTGRSTDMAIKGNGFFIVNDGKQNLFTRTGAFTFNAQGTMVDAGTGFVVQGKVADSNGRINTTSAIGDIRLPPGKQIAPNATSELNLAGNLNADTVTRTQLLTGDSPFTSGNNPATALTAISDLDQVSTPLEVDDTIVITGTNPDGSLISATYTYKVGDTLQNVLDVINGALSGATAAINAAGSLTVTDNDPGASQTSLALTMGTANTGAANLPQLRETVGGSGRESTTVQAYDSLGNQHAVTIAFTQTQGGTWSWKASVAGDASVLGGDTGSIIFNPDGSVQSLTYDNGNAFRFEPATGATPLSISFNPGSGHNGMTQFGASSTLHVKDQDGYGRGTLDNITINSAGIITGRFSNGATRDIAHISLANFTNQNGLEKVGSNMFVGTTNSNLPVIGNAGTDFGAEILAGHLEMSNVDLSKEFTDMIVTQRGFQANARIITTSDEIIRDMISLKQ